MIRKLLLLGCMVTSLAHADMKHVNVQLENIKVIDLAKIVYTDMLKRPYVINSDALALADLVTIDVQGLKPAQIEAQLIDLLDLRGFAVEVRHGISTISKKQEAEKEVFIYRPKYRGVSYLLDLVQGLFPQGSFTSQRAISNPAAFGQQQGTGTTQLSTFDTGTNAASLIDRGDKDAIVFNGTAANIKKLQKLFDQVDIAGAEMMIKAVIYEVQRGRKDVSAVDLAANILSGRFGITLANGAASGAAATIKTGGVQAIISALNTDNRFKLISSPSLRVRDGIQARFSVGADVPVLGAVTYQKDGQPVQSVDYKPSGVILQVRPRIREQGAELEINQQLSNFIPTTTGVNQSPTLTKREASTTVQVDLSDVVILGGLDEDKTTKNSSFVPFLPDWLGSDSEDSQRTEILLVIQVQRI